MIDHHRQSRRKRFVAVAVAGAMLMPMAGASANDRYSDVAPNSTHASAIAEMSDRGHLRGKADGTFDAEGTLTRAQMASVLARVADVPALYEYPFLDVGPSTHAANIAAAHAAGLIQGYPDGTFRPDVPVTRDQIAVMLWRWLDMDEVTDGDFTDLQNTAHELAINALAAEGIAQGYQDGTFDPRGHVRRDQAASFVWRAVEWKEAQVPDPEPHPWDEIGEDVLSTADLPEDADVHGVEYHGRIEVSGTSAVNPVRYEDGETLVTTGAFGMRIYDLRDRYEPKLIGVLPKEELALETDDPTRNYHSAESLNIDKELKVAILSRDPRAFGNPQTTSPSGFYLIDIADPTNPELLHWQQVGAGHTTTCVNDCDQVWSGGPSRDRDDPEDWIARPIMVSDLSGLYRDDNGDIQGLRTVYTHPTPVDMNRYRGITDYAHDVQVDQQGIAWVSGRGGVRGYHTSGTHYDPVLNRNRTAFAHNPVPYAGGEVGEYNDPDDPRRIAGAIHNLERPVDGDHGPSAWTDSERPFRPGANDGADLEAGGYDPGELVYVVDENFTGPCTDSGKFYINSIAGADEGQHWKYDEVGPFALEEVGVWSVAGKEGSSNPNSSCSAHYFNMQDGVVAGGWYGQGFRFLDVTDPTDPIQIAYVRYNGMSGWSTHWVDEIIYANDSRNGILILTLDEEAAEAAESRDEVLAPVLEGSELQAAMDAEVAMIPDPIYGWSCALPADYFGDDVPETNDVSLVGSLPGSDA